MTLPPLPSSAGDRFHVETVARRGAGETDGRGYSGAVRPQVFAIAVIAAVLGAAGALALGGLTGLTEGGTTTVVVERTITGADAAAAPAVPAVGNGFNPAAIYARRAPGVVTDRAVDPRVAPWPDGRYGGLTAFAGRRKRGG